MTQPRVQGWMSGTQTTYTGPTSSRLSRKALVFFFCTTRRRQHGQVTSETCSIRILSLPTNGRRLLEQSGGASLRDPALRPRGQPRGRAVLCHMMLGISMVEVNMDQSHCRAGMVQEGGITASTVNHQSTCRGASRTASPQLTSAH